MKRIVTLTFLFLTLLIAGCATTPPPKMMQPSASGIAISVKLQRPLGWPTDDAGRVYFVKLKNGNNLQEGTIIQSNYEKDGRIYLLNATPGNYVAVAAWTSMSVASGTHGVFNNVEHITLFSRDVIELTRVSVGGGQIVCAGNFLFKTSAFGDLDQIQQHYHDALRNHPSDIVGYILQGSSPWFHRGTLAEVQNDNKAKDECLRKAKEDLAQGGWAEIIK